MRVRVEALERAQAYAVSLRPRTPRPVWVELNGLVDVDRDGLSRFHTP